jgi:hypothetical protein
MYLKQGEHLMKKGIYASALFYLNQSLNINPESKVKLFMKDKGKDTDRDTDRDKDKVKDREK